MVKVPKEVKQSEKTSESTGLAVQKPKKIYMRRSTGLPILKRKKRVYERKLPYARKSVISVSTEGRIRLTNGTITTGTANAHGYRFMHFKHHGRYNIHRVVIANFAPQPSDPKRKYVDHIDRNPSNNSLSNLRYVTAEENMKNGSRSFTKTQPIEARLLTSTTWRHFDSVREATKTLRVASDMIRKALQSDTKCSKTYEFRAVGQEEIDGEIFRQLRDTIYFVSNFGRVKNTTTQKILYGNNSNGYLRVRIYRRNCFVHHLVAECFEDIVGKKPSEKHTIDHIDAVPLNNNASNLRWCTRSEQVKNSWTSGNRGDFAPTTPPVLGKKVGETEWTLKFISTKEASEKLCLPIATIGRVCRKQLKAINGYVFCFQPQPDLPGEIWKPIDWEIMKADKEKMKAAK